MAKMTLEDLRRMREEKQKAMEMRDSANKDIQVILPAQFASAKAVFPMPPA